MTVVHPEAVAELARGSVGRLRQRVRQQAPGLAVVLERWMRELAGGLPPENYFLHRQAFPMLALPWWLEASAGGTPEPVFQAELAYSSVGGYYFVRLVDDVMDRQRPVPARLAPALIVLHTEFERTYAGLFPADHPFWKEFLRFSYEAAETASVDAGLTDVSRDDFLRVSSRKIAGAKLPLAAVCYRHGRYDLLDSWTSFVDLLGCWHQMLNDIHGWSRDAATGAATYFLSEGRRRAGTDGQDRLVAWMLEEGLAWGWAQLDAWMEELLEAAAALGSPDLLDYLRQRYRIEQVDRRPLEVNLQQLRDISTSLR